MTRLACLVALALLCGAAAAAAYSQEAPKRHRRGLWGELGSGPGYARIACTDCEEVVGATGTTGYLRVGGVISKKVVIGVEFFSFLDKAFGFAPEDSNAVAETATAAIVLLWYPGRHGLFFKGGVGAAFGEFAVPYDSGGVAVADTSSGGGMGLTFGVGWDFAISRKFTITANAATFVTALGDVALPGRKVDDVIATIYHASIGFTIR